MLLSVIKGECIKLRRAPVWIAFLLLPLLSAVMGTFNYLQNLGILKKAWFSLWTQHTLFLSFFFLPALIGVLAAYQWRLEHREYNWNRLMTEPISIRLIVVGKLVVTGGMVLLTLAFTGLLYYLAGRYAGLTGAMPGELPVWLIRGAAAGISIASVQLYLSMRIKSFAVPVGIALVGGIAGLLFANYGYGLYFPYALLAVGMDANGRAFLGAGDTLPFLFSCTLYTLLFCLLAIRALKKRNIDTK